MRSSRLPDDILSGLGQDSLSSHPSCMVKVALVARQVANCSNLVLKDEGPPRHHFDFELRCRTPDHCRPGDSTFITKS